MNAFGQLVGPGVPDPHHYDDWKEWARDLGQMMAAQEQVVTQAQIENLLNYSTGAWTPTLVGATTPGTYALATGSTARYLRIAALVVVAMKATITVTAAGTGDIHIGGLPVSMLANSVALGTVDLERVAYPDQMFAHALNDVVTIRGMSPANPIGILDVGGLRTGSIVGLSFWYLTNP